MREADSIRLKHMLDAANEISKFTKEITKGEFKKDRKLHLSIVRLLEIIGEAAAKIEPDVQSKYNQIPWKGIIGMRNRLIHGYFDIDLEIVWETVKGDIPNLISELEKVVQNLE